MGPFWTSARFVEVGFQTGLPPPPPESNTLLSSHSSLGKFRRLACFCHGADWALVPDRLP